jgi:PAS domain S-box-containing protein
MHRKTRLLSQKPLTVSPDTPISIVLQHMEQARQSCVVVVDGQKPVGIFTERDLVKLLAQQRSLTEVSVAEFMTRQVVMLERDQAKDVTSVFQKMQQHRIRHLPVVDEQGNLVAIVTTRSLRETLKPTDLLKLRRVSEAMVQTVVYCSADCSVLEVVQTMAEAKTSCVVITETNSLGDKIPVGVITERDTVSFQNQGIDLHQSAQSVMSAPLILVHPEDTLMQIYHLMNQHRVRRLVVAGNQGELVGIITQTQILQTIDPSEAYSLIQVLQHEVQQLQVQNLALLEQSNRELEIQLQHKLVEHQQAKLALQQLNVELERRVVERTTELTDANNKLQTELAERARAELALRQSELKFSTIFQDSPQPAWTATLAEGRYLDVNQGFSYVLGYSRAEVVGKTCIELNLWNDLRDLQHFRETLRQTGNVLDFEAVFRTKSGEAKTVLLSARVSRLNDQDCVVGVLSDISDRKRAEQDLQRAKAEAEAANQAKSIFLASMSHELRTPLNSILGFTRLLAMQQDVALPPEHQEYIQIIERNGIHLLGLINDVLDLAKIEAEKLSRESQEINLSDLLKLLESTFSQQVNGKKLDLRLVYAPDVPRRIIADAQKLQQVLINLLSNAIKFTQQGGVALSIEIGNWISDRQKHLLSAPVIPLRFEVQDTGCGIAPQELPLIFDAFAQAETGRRTAGGTGLGLAISQKLVQIMGGEITVESILEQGSQFRFTIPVQLTDSAAVPLQMAKRQIIGLAPDQPRYRMLVVDDHRVNRLLIVKLLEPLGIEVKEATDGEQAVTLWQQWQPHLIWMDMRMPNLDGNQATRRIRAEEAAQNPARRTIIIGVTAQATIHDRTLVLEAGCDDFISKPIEVKQLFEKMKQYLGLSYLYNDAAPLS